MASIGLGVIAMILMGQTQLPPAPNTSEFAEFRAAWVATVANIDWPSKPGLSVAQQRAELDSIIETAAELNLNAIVLQVAPANCAIFPSSFAPWTEYLSGTQGRAPGPDWDPLQYAIRRSHEKGIELHAWFNPFRSRHATAKSPQARGHIASRNPGINRVYGNQQWLDPGDPVAREHAIAFVIDTVRRYDLDAVHIDDYFYPYPIRSGDREISFPDKATFAAYQHAGGKLGLADWRRNNVNQFVQEFYRRVKIAKPWVKVGISPFGIYRPGIPAGIRGMDQYNVLYADPRLWLREGWLDYFAPQLYWPIGQEGQDFATLLSYWHTENRRNRNIWPGIYTSRLLPGGTYRPDEIHRQVALVRESKPGTGVIHFSFKALQQDAQGVASGLKSNLYAEPALIPSSDWLGRQPKAPILLSLERRGTQGIQATLKWENEPRWIAAAAFSNGRWRLLSSMQRAAPNTDWPVKPADSHIAFAAVNRANQVSDWVIRQIPR
jgi:uncharacterized lipoprotein YddW (UPF0748 family)